ncbi:alpha-tocopherol transfer protein-like isoform X1 [Colias croceus]|uniref:alpha-tocopherol transfer protein-like isoform X1 n=2 Tax=Colias crocea TaxID=72248 RepID=UPI001E2811F0|nr:alpha-tocopherol transfer protein-like isoform X1 [Colias croceus]XP_045490787.1 alpha-tocopherol transfer protein-like isoform X1 [Colias croceus]
MLKIRPLPQNLQEIAEKELHEKTERLAADVTAIRNWLQKQPHLHKVSPPDQIIVSFLRGNKFSLERTKEKLDMSYTLRTVVPELFQKRDPLDPKLNEILKRGFSLPLNTVKKGSGRPVLLRYGFPDGKLFPVEDLMKICYMVIEILMQEDDNFIVVGEEAIVDLKDISLAAIGQWTPALAKKVITSFEKALPVRVKNMHLLNPPPGFETMFAFIKSFMSDKLKKRIHLHNPPYENFHKEFSQEALPVEYGGKNGTIQELTDYWKAKVESYRDWFLAEESIRSDESRRPEKPKTASSLFGLEGSFRKLDVD